MKKRLLCVLVFLAVGASCVFAQSPDATIGGRISDPSGAVIPGVKIVAVNDATGVEHATTTNDAGIYLIPSLSPGKYHIELSKQGFKTLMKPNITLNVQDYATVNFTLEVGAVSEVVTVEGGSLIVNTTDASVSTVIDRQFAENLPMNGRSFQTLLYLTPGVTLSMGSGPSSTYATGQFSVNGQRASSNYWMVDGVSGNIGSSPWFLGGNGSSGSLGAFNVMGGTNSLVSVDALQEFRIETSTYAPEFGRTVGGQISIVTRSGTNQFHGTAFDYFRNTVLDAKDWFASAHQLPKAGEEQNDFGGVVGGPVIKDRTFFFFSYEGVRVTQPQTVFTTVPDLAARANAIPAVQPFIDAYPLPTPGLADVGPGYAPFNATFSEPASVDAYSIRVDHTLTKALNLFGRYSYSPSYYDTRGSAGDTANTVEPVTSNTTTVTAGVTWTKSAQVVNELRFNYSQSGGETTAYMDTFGGGTPAPAQALFPSPFTYKNSAFFLGTFFGTNMTEFEGRSGGNTQHQYNIVDTLSMQRGAHSLKFGVDYRRLSPFFDPRPYALIPYFADMADFEAGTTGIAGTYLQHPGPTTFLFRNVGVFAQDTWRVNTRLTLTYGLRWDIDFTPTTENGQPIPAVTGFTYTDLSNIALAPTGTSIYGTRFGAVAPRFGAAYQISQNPGWGLVFRGGFGLFYDLSSSEVGNAGTGLYPYDTTVSMLNVPFPTPPNYAAQPPIDPPNPQNGETLFGFDPHLNVPYTVQFNSADGLLRDFRC